MNRAIWKELTPAIVVAMGILASTQVAAMLVSSGLLVMAGPLTMVVALVVASLLTSRLRGRDGGGRGLSVALILGGITLVVSAILALKDPANVADMMPILGAGMALPIIVSSRRPAGSRCAQL